ncbi:hypothetical protein OH77DRAFT_1429013 [Trametes cingulata]|nr:hypothetical protein OH77DRAFT_1429013 [Trametes cingulata]
MDPLTSARPSSAYRGMTSSHARHRGQTPEEELRRHVLTNARDIPTLRRIVRRFAEPHLRYLAEVHSGVEVLMGLTFYVLSDPHVVIGRIRVDRRWTARALSSVRRVGWDVLSDVGLHIRYGLRVAYKFLFAPWSPEGRVSLAYAWLVATDPEDGKAADKKYFVEPPEPPPAGMVRVKWYPDLHSARCWAADYAPLWVELPLEPDGSLNLRPLKALWGMQNCYVVDRVPGRRVRIGRRPDEKLSALAWHVLLEGHSALGVIECPTRSMKAARKGREFTIRAIQACLLHPVESLAQGPRLLWRASMVILETTVWMAITLLAISVFVAWPLLDASIALALLCSYAVLVWVLVRLVYVLALLLECLLMCYVRVRSFFVKTRHAARTPAHKRSLRFGSYGSTMRNSL